MILRILNIILLFVAILLVAFAPEKYSYEFCCWILGLTLVSGVFNLRKSIQNNGLVHFNTFFIPSLILMNFLHAVFLYSSAGEIFSVFNFHYNHGIICYSIAVGFLAMQLYFLTYNCYSVYYKKKKTKKKSFYINDNIALLTQVLAFGSIAGIVIYSFFILDFQGGIEHIYPRLLVLVESVVMLSLLFSFYKLSDYNNSFKLKDILNANKLNVVLLGAFTLTLMYLGARGGLIFLLLFAASIYRDYIRQIGLFAKTVGVILFFFAFFIMSIMTLTRIGDVNFSTASPVEVVQKGIEILQESPQSIFILFTDFIVNNRNLYVGVDYPSTYGLLWGQSYVPYIFSPVPMGGTFFSELITGKPIDEVNTGAIITNLGGADYGLGTNLIGDLYMNLGLFGVLVGLFLLGKIVAYSEHTETIVGITTKHVLTAYSFFLPRACIFGWIDAFWFVLIGYGVLRFINRVKF